MLIWCSTLLAALFVLSIGLILYQLYKGLLVVKCNWFEQCTPALQGVSWLYFVHWIGVHQLYKGSAGCTMQCTFHSVNRHYNWSYGCTVYNAENNQAVQGISWLCSAMCFAQCTRALHRVSWLYSVQCTEFIICTRNQPVVQCNVQEVQECTTRCTLHSVTICTKSQLFSAEYQKPSPVQFAMERSQPNLRWKSGKKRGTWETVC